MMKQVAPLNLSALLSDLSDLAGTFNRKSDSLNELIRRFEDTLRQLNIGVDL